MVLDLLPPPPKSRAIAGELLFLQPWHHRPVVSFQRLPTGEYSEAYAPRRVRIDDARALLPRLDVEGFALVNHCSAVSDFWDDAQAHDLGRTEAAEIVAKATGSDWVFVFDHTLRRRAPNAPRQPSTRVHIDYTPASARRRVEDLLGAKVARGNFAFINVWRPIRHPAVDWPLALADARSVDAGDLVETDIDYGDRRGEIFHVRYNEGQRWYCAPGMELDEALLIKCADTRPGKAQGAPHTAFAHPGTPPDAPARESIEFRTIAFFD
jgi:hypothetical protein